MACNDDGGGGDVCGASPAPTTTAPPVMVVVVMGLPGAGKTTLCKRLQCTGATTDVGVDVVTFDDAHAVSGVLQEWDAKQWRVDREEAMSTLEATLQRAHERSPDTSVLRAHLVLVDDHMHYRSMRRHVWKLARKFEIRYSCVFVDVSTCVALERAAHRKEHHVPPSVIERMALSMDVPQPAGNSCGWDVAVRWSSLGGDVKALLATLADRAKRVDLIPKQARAEPMRETVVSRAQCLDQALRHAMSNLMRDECFRGAVDVRRVSQRRRQTYQRHRETVTLCASQSQASSCIDNLAKAWEVDMKRAAADGELRQ